MPHAECGSASGGRDSVATIEKRTGAYWEIASAVGGPAGLATLSPHPGRWPDWRVGPIGSRSSIQLEIVDRHGPWGSGGVRPTPNNCQKAPLMSQRIKQARLPSTPTAAAPSQLDSVRERKASSEVPVPSPSWGCVPFTSARSVAEAISIRFSRSGWMRSDPRARSESDRLSHSLGWSSLASLRPRRS